MTLQQSFVLSNGFDTTVPYRPSLVPMIWSVESSDDMHPVEGGELEPPAMDWAPRLTCSSTYLDAIAGESLFGI